MTRRAAGSAGGVPRIWLLPIVVASLLLGVSAAGILSRAIVIDLIAWWPVWLGLALAALLARGRTIGKVRASGLVPLLATGALVLFAVGHLSGWPAMPSASVRLVGPVPDPSLHASLTARINGDLRLAGGSDFLYQVEPIRRGGSIGLPSATEETQGLAVSVTLDQPADPGFYAFSGWDVSITNGSLWDLTLEGMVEADLTTIEITGLQLFGEGFVSLAATSYSAPVAVLGDFDLAISDSVPARIIGEADVPDSWEKTTDGWRSPAPGDGWVISPAQGSTLTVVNG